MSGSIQHFDAAIIGGGSAGYAAARTLASAGKSVAVVDGGRQLGGLCILRGCMPTKALLQAGEVAHAVHRAATWGIRVDPAEVRVDFPALMARKDRLIREFADFRQGQLADGRFTLFRSTARLESARRLRLSDGTVLTVDHVILATGSEVAPFPESLIPLQAAGCWTSDDALIATHAPRSLIVLGGGPVAVELAQFYQRIGTRVILIQRSAHILRDADPDAARVVEAVLQREGIALHTSTRITGSGASFPGGRWVEFEQDDVRHRVEADQVLVALGRVPATTGLGLEELGVRMDGRRILTDPTQATSVPGIWAAGDCCGPFEIVHIAIQQGETAARNIVGVTPPVCMDYRLLTQVVFTEPQLASVGLTEAEARRRGVPHRTASYPFNDHGKSLIMEALDGFVRLLCDPVSGEILGGCCVGPLAGELIHEIVVAMARRMTVKELAAIPHYHPTLAEIWTYPAEELAGQIRG